MKANGKAFRILYISMSFVCLCAHDFPIVNFISIACKDSYSVYIEVHADSNIKGTALIIPNEMAVPNVKKCQRLKRMTTTMATKR